LLTAALPLPPPPLLSGPTSDGADSLRDWWYSPFHYRVHGAANMLLEAYHWLSSHLPYWCAVGWGGRGGCLVRRAARPAWQAGEHLLLLFPFRVAPPPSHAAGGLLHLS
jgi:hypothetical protein